MEKQTTFEEDDAVMTKLFIMEAGLSNNKRIIRVAATIMETMGSYAQSVIQYFKDGVEKEGLRRTLVKYVVEGGLLTGMFGLGWLGTLFEVGCRMFGISPGDYVNKIFDYIYEAVTGGKITASTTADDAKKLAEDVVKTKVGLPGAAASLEILHTLNKQGRLHELILNHKKMITKNASTRKNATSISELLTGGKATTFFGGALQWIISLVIAAIAGLIAVKGIEAVKSYMSGPANATPAPTGDAGAAGTAPSSGGFSILDWFGGNKAKTEALAKPPQYQYDFPKVIVHKVSPSGEGEQYHINDEYTHWIIGLVDGSVKKTLLYWTYKIYPFTRKWEKVVLHNESFNKMVSLLSKSYDGRYPKGLVVLPESGLHTWREIIEKFAGHVFEDIKEKIDNGETGDIVGAQKSVTTVTRPGTTVTKPDSAVTKTDTGLDAKPSPTQMSHLSVTDMDSQNDDSGTDKK